MGIDTASTVATFGRGSPCERDTYSGRRLEALR